jgi:uncharacterized protein (TIGR00730 family)
MNLKNIFKKRETKQNNLLKVSDLRKLIKQRMAVANEEFNHGYQVIEKHPKSVSILGSARFLPDHEYYKKAESIARRIVTDLKYSVVTGGGPGIMEAANKGAFEAGGKSIGFGIKLPKEQELNKYLTDSVNFEYFFSRKTVLFFAAEAYIYFPGGFGTMDELFEVLTLMQTGEISRAPVILVGRDFWEPLMDIVEKEMLEEEKTISPEDANIYRIVESEDEIIEIIKNAPIRQTD